MPNTNAETPIRRNIKVEVSREKAFKVFTEEFSYWWPHEYTWSQDVLETIGIEPGKGGHCFEIGPHGFHCDWGRVLLWEPPHRLVISWQISPQRVPEPNPEKSSEVEVRFEEGQGSTTRVELEHRNFNKHGVQAAEYRTGMDSPEGWAYILDRFAKFCG